MGSTTAKKTGAGWALRLVLLTIGVVVVSVMLVAMTKSGSFYRVHASYICSRCGALRLYGRSTFFGVMYRQRESVHPTPVSLVLEAGRTKSCTHQWFVYGIGSYSHSLFRGGEHGDGGGPGASPLARVDTDFPKELASMPDPEVVWNTIYLASITDTDFVDHLFMPWFEQQGHPSLQTVWAENKLKLGRMATEAQRKYPYGRDVPWQYWR